jgi:hypothetical protein
MPLPIALDSIADFSTTRVLLINGKTESSVLASVLFDAAGATYGDFSGPSSAVDGNFVAFDGTTGKLGKDSGKSPSDILSVGTTAGTVAAGDDSRITGAAQSTDLASTASSKGASLIGIQDAAANYAATTVEAALAEIATEVAGISPDYGAGNAALSFGDVGTYCLAGRPSGAGTITRGSTLAGSNLQYGYAGTSGAVLGTTSLSGTWRLMSESMVSSHVGLWLRIS